MTNLALDEANRTAIAAAGGIEALVALASHGEPQGQSYAAGALINLATDDAFREAIAAAGGIETLVVLARNGDAQGRANAAGALASLACAQAHHLAIVAAGGIETLVALSGEGDAQGKAYAAAALSFLSHGKSMHLEAIVAAGGIEALAALARDGDAQAKAYAAVALANLVPNGASGASGFGGGFSCAGVPVADVPHVIQATLGLMSPPIRQLKPLLAALGLAARPPNGFPTGGFPTGGFPTGGFPTAGTIGGASSSEAEPLAEVIVSSETLSRLCAVLASTDDILASTDDVLASTDDVLASTDDVLASTEDVLASTDDGLASTDDVPASTDDVPATAHAAVTNLAGTEALISGEISANLLGAARTAFELFAESSTGTISIAELELVLLSLGVHRSDAEVNALLASLGRLTHDHERVSFGEFTRVLLGALGQIT